MRVIVRKDFSAFLLAVLLGLVLCVLRPHLVHAISDSLLIMQLQTAGSVSGTASEELVILYNQSADDVNISNWCLEYSSAANGVTFSKLACIDSGDELVELWVSSGGFVSFATQEYLLKNPTFTPDFTFNAGLAATGGHLRLMRLDATEVDRVSWGTAVTVGTTVPAPSHTVGSTLSRNPSALVLDTDNALVDFSSRSLIEPLVSGIYEVEVQVDVCANIPDLQIAMPTGFLADEDGDCYADVCPNIEELQKSIPEGYEILLGTTVCTEIPLEDAIIFITELLANAPSSDDGQEYIEFYNPNDGAVDLTGYKILVGPGFTKQYKLPSFVMPAKTYVVFRDTDTALVLPNATGVQLRLVAPAGNIVSETPAYTDAEDDVTWAFVNDQWVYTNQITPAAPNQPYLDPPEDEVDATATALGPCPAGKYRNPDTNRCRSIETAVSQLKPCDEDEFRNPETNRCKKVATSTLAACAVGQERNPETNRCRKVNVLGTSVNQVPTVTDVTVAQSKGHINWPVILAALGGTFAYVLYEWRPELTRFYMAQRSKRVQ